MNKTKKFFKGISFSLDALFFRNLTLLLAAIFVWRGAWNLLDKYFFPGNFLVSNLGMILIGIFLLFLFDAEVEEDIDSNGKKHKHLTDDIL